MKTFVVRPCLEQGLKTGFLICQRSRALLVQRQCRLQVNSSRLNEADYREIRLVLPCAEFDTGYTAATCIDGAL
jgi:hypothetical protein